MYDVISFLSLSTVYIGMAMVLTVLPGLRINPHFTDI